MCDESLAWGGARRPVAADGIAAQSNNNDARAQ
jgi:hypothetical protein